MPRLIKQIKQAVNLNYGLYIRGGSMNIIEKITQAIFEDDEDPNKQSEYLIETYLNSTNQIEIDAIFVCLC
ncbi:hypothetical protein [Legionella saoudiensis]|nr:hypothetical protein [Legionella saoudiensis]